MNLKREKISYQVRQSASSISTPTRSFLSTAFDEKRINKIINESVKEVANRIAKKIKENRISPPINNERQILFKPKS